MTQSPKIALDDRRSGGGLTSWVTAGICALLLLWMGLGWETIASRDNYVGKKPDYYSLLVHGFLKGHLYMDVIADPGLESPDPAVRARAFSLMDASYYKGRYYLYFGAAPAALFLLPYAWLTGGDLQPRFIVALCVLTGFFFSVGILRMAARDFFGRTSAVFQIAAVAVLAFATAAPSLLTRAMFYEVAIASGYAFTMAGLFWSYRAIFGKGRTWLQLGLASLAFGLGVGCRPDLVLALPVVAAAALLAAWRMRDRAPFARGLLRLGTAAVAPAAFVGALLAAYNYERFGNPGEFGVTYSMNYFMRGDKPLFSTGYLWPNIHWYYLTPPSLSPYFPYVFPEEAYFGPPAYPWGEAIHGQSIVVVMGALVAAAAILAWRRLRVGRLGAYLGLLAFMFAALLVAISAIGFRGDRYLVDCQPSLVLGIVLLAGAAGAAGGWGSPILRAFFPVLAALSAAFNILGGIQEFGEFKNVRTSTFQVLESLGNYPACWLGRIGVLAAGPVELKVVFPTDPKVAAVEPLLVAGTPEYTDSLYVVEWAGGKEIELLGDHSGFGGPRSGVLAITPGQAYSIKIDMGAFYPPLSPPFSTDYGARKIRMLKSGLRVEMDGRAVLDRKMNSYDAPPWTIESGRNDITMNPFKTEFTGRILSQTRLPPPTLLDKRQTGLCRIRCVFPMDRPGTNFPLVALGETGSGTLLYVSVVPGDKVRFGVDEWSIGGGISEAIAASPQSDHLIEVLIGPLAAGTKWPADWGVSPQELGRFVHSLRIWLDGRLVWTTRLKRPLDPLDPMFDVGTNHQGFSTAQPEFRGLIMEDPYIPSEAREFLGRNLDSGAPAAQPR